MEGAKLKQNPVRKEKARKQSGPQNKSNI